MFTELSRDLLGYRNVRCRLGRDTCGVVGALDLRCRVLGCRRDAHCRHCCHSLLATAAGTALPAEIPVIIGGRALYHSDDVIYHGRREHRDSVVTCVKAASCFCDFAVRHGLLNSQ